MSGAPTRLEPEFFDSLETRDPERREIVRQTYQEIVAKEGLSILGWRSDMPIDKRADLVNDCVTQALKEHPLQ